MTRKIKFRAWWVDEEYNPEGTMYFVGGLIFAIQQEGEPEFDNCGTPKEIGLMESVDNSKLYWKNAKECILMQYTGLKDKNGKEIYEGDIIESTWNGTRYVVEWDENDGQWCYCRDCNEDAKYKGAIVIGNIYENNKQIEIIGNIYENPQNNI